MPQKSNEDIKRIMENIQMPTILLCKGWRIFFFANEGFEPIHVHCRKGDAKGKFWILTEEYEIRKAYVRYMTKKQEREIRKILFDHFEEIIEAWNNFTERKDDK